MAGTVGRAHYEVLGVAVDADTDEIRQAYLRLARAHHPDRGSGDAGNRMRDLNAAWAVLGDPARRAAYDLDRGASPTGAGPRDFVRRPDDTFVPYDDEDDDVAVDELSDEGDPRTSPGRVVLLAPVVLGALALFVGFGWILIDDDRLLAVAVALGVVAAVSFLAVPLVAMTRAARFERR